MFLLNVPKIVELLPLLHNQKTFKHFDNLNFFTGDHKTENQLNHRTGKYAFLTT